MCLIVFIWEEMHYSWSLLIIMDRRRILPLLAVRLVNDDDDGMLNDAHAVLGEFMVDGMQEGRGFHVRNENYFEGTIPNYSEGDFRAHFRMTRRTMEVLVNVIGNRMIDRQSFIVPLEKQVLLTVWIISKAESFLAVGDRFGISSSTAHLCFANITRTLATLVGTYIRWPTADQMQNIAQDFEIRSRGFPGVVGAIDGCHIQIMQPVNNPVDYYNRKGFHSVILQAVCDNRGRFIDAHIGVPGRVHDARVFRNSPLMHNIVNHQIVPAGKHLIGDSAYPLNSYLLVPFRDNGHLNAGQVRFNQKLSCIRSTVERAFGMLKGKFRKLRYLEMSNLHLINYTIAVACILHNFILDHEGNAGEDDYERVDMVNNVADDEGEDIEEDDDAEDGRQKRNRIMRILYGQGF